jgi:ribosomal-protein-alanine N-acetyltransferase
MDNAASDRSFLVTAPLQIETVRLRLRPAAPSDIDDLHRLWTDPDVRRYLWDDVVISRERAAEVVKESLASLSTERLGHFVVSPRVEETLIGFCGLRRFGPERDVEVLFGIQPARWGRGFATEAARTMLRYGFEEAGLDRIFAGADPPNAASFRVMEKLGMRFAKRLVIGGREAIYWDIARADLRPGDASDAGKR